MSASLRSQQESVAAASPGEDDLVHVVLSPARRLGGRPGAAAGTAGRYWLHARLYAPSRRHDALLARHFPVVLESLPDGVDRWFFLRHTGPDPHLRLSFGGAGSALCTQLPANLQCWIAELVTAGQRPPAGAAERSPRSSSPDVDALATRLAVDVCGPAVGDAAVTAEAEDVLHAASDAVLAQLRLAHAKAFAIRSDMLEVLGLAEIARAYHGEADRADWVRVMRSEPDLALLAPWWDRRAEALGRYGARVRRVAARYADPALVDTVLNSLLRMHNNQVRSHRPPADVAQRSRRSSGRGQEAPGGAQRSG